MPILLFALLAVGYAWLRGVPPTELAALRLRWMAVPLAAFVIQALTFVRLEQLLGPFAPALHILSLLLLMAFVLANAHYRTLIIVAVGLALNVAVIAANGGYMPVRVADVERNGFAGPAAVLASGQHFQKSIALDEHTRLPWLADVITVPMPGPDHLLSAGDLFIAAGTFLFLQAALLERRAAHRSDTLQHASAAG